MVRRQNSYPISETRTLQGGKVWDEFHGERIWHDTEYDLGYNIQTVEGRGFI